MIVPTNINKVAFYNGEVSSIAVELHSSSERADSTCVKYCTDRNLFVKYLKSGSTNRYYISWPNGQSWNYLINHPYLDVLYIDVSNGKKYIFESRTSAQSIQYERVEVTEGDLCSVAELVKPNGIMHLSFDFILMGDTQMGENSQIFFEGGKIYGNTSASLSFCRQPIIIGNNTALSAPIVQLFAGEYPPLLEGVWNIGDCYPEWWGAMGDGETDDSAAIQNAVNSPINSVKLLEKTYAVGSAISISHPLVLQGAKQKNDHTGCPMLRATNRSIPYVLGISSPFVTLKNFTVKYNTAEAAGIGVKTTDEYYRLVLEGVAAVNCLTGFDLHTYLSTIERCTSTGGNIGFIIKGGTSITVQNCFVKSFVEHAFSIPQLTYSTFINCCADTHKTSSPDGTSGDNHARSIYGHTFYFKNSKSITLLNCASEQVSKGFAFDNCDTIQINNCRMDMQRISNCKKQDDQATYHGTWLYCTGTKRLVVDGMYLINDLKQEVGTPSIDFSSWIHGWYDCTNLIYCCTNSQVKLKNIFLTGKLNTTVQTTISQYVRSSLITYDNSSTMMVEYDHWKHSGMAVERPQVKPSGDDPDSVFSAYDFDEKIGVGFTYLLLEDGGVTFQVWDGTYWRDVYSITNTHQE